MGLGILRGTSSTGYRLRSPNVLRLVGGEEEVLEQLGRFENEPPDVQADARVIHLPVEPREKGITSPLTWWQENQLSFPRSSLAVVVGSRALALDRVATTLESLWSRRAQHAQITRIDANGDNVHSEVYRRIREAYTRGKRAKDLHIVLETRPTGRDPSALVQLLDDLVKWQTNLTTEKRGVLIGCIIDAPTWYRLSESGKAGRLKKRQAPKDSKFLEAQFLRRWNRAALLDWFDVVERPPETGTVDRWLEATGGWPSLLNPVQEAFASGADVSTLLAGPSNPEAFLEDAGVLSGPILPFYRAMTEYGDPVDEEMVQLLAEETNGLEPEQVGVILDYLSDLDLVVRDRDGIHLDPVVASLVNRLGTGAAAR